MSRRHSRGARSRLLSRAAVIVAGVFLLSWAGPGASAFWTAVSNSSSATAAADSVAAGATPSTSVSAGSVTLAWNASATLAGRPLSGYAVARYASATGGEKVPVGGSCAGTVTAGLGCTDQSVPTGTWYYTITPVLEQWRGTESVRSAGAVVDTTPPKAPFVTAPAFVNSGNVSAVPVSGTTEPGATIALAVKDGGSAHTVTATVTANAAGEWNAAVNLSALGEGAVTFSAVATDTAGNQGDPGTASSFKDVAVPRVTDVLLANGGSKTGKVEPGDKVTITFSEALDASTICSSWAAGSDGTLNGSNQIMVNISSTNVLSLTVAATACPTSGTGTVTLGATYFGSGNLSYGGSGSSASTLAWNAAAKTLTITLGALATGSPATANAGAAAASYLPVGGMKDVAGNGVATNTFTGPSASRF
ncbi:Ig-like domain-containing protein [Arthrobacter sp. PM3]|uniref:Ig-like domain-containing protein n=1 Tax=Arthrobacter sp. PM3 TaxID=2017685 RepID=UPI000E101A1D|nr:Ig-like domain-containing protein [Arthrobacter sp. PM3]AXJ08860.1 hypothetical protein CFN17_03905 [Arthrobacter sp. PM3]